MRSAGVSTCSMSLPPSADSWTSLRERLVGPFGGASDVFLFGASNQRYVSGIPMIFIEIYLLVEAAFVAGFAPGFAPERVCREVAFEGGASFELFFLLAGMSARCGQRLIACTNLEGAHDPVIAKGLRNFFIVHALYWCSPLFFPAVILISWIPHYPLPLWPIFCNFTAGILSIVVRT